jgi:hypothetical protein
MRRYVTIDSSEGNDILVDCLLLRLHALELLAPLDEKKYLDMRRLVIKNISN